MRWQDPLIFLSATSVAIAVAQPIAVQAQGISYDCSGQLQRGDRVLESDGSLYDICEFEAQAGQSISITLESVDFDTVLAVIDSEGNLLASNDDIDENTTNSALTVTFPADGIYRLIVNAYDAEGSGGYILSATGSGDIQKPINQPRENTQMAISSGETAAQFYNRYQRNPGAIPIPDCATRTSKLTRSEIQQVLLEHNRSRKDADRYVPNGLPPLPAVIWNCDAAAVAQQWADQSRGSQGHSANAWRQQQFSNRTGLQGGAAKLGENLAWSGGSDRSVVSSVVSSVTRWDDERKDYNHNTQACQGVCGHYTQMVWRESTAIGCGIYRGPVRWPGGDRTWPEGYFLSCTYHNAGNFNNDNPLIDHPDWYYD
ncbi:CAP domain-containing protein [Roseofilum reptotaenium CS-1145]|uniref:SCP domain-containing protein n=1 Tax=Roseofilum reptotaenium AO1-A TaxID=1925591 RepID=A0A1L9QWZ4_9CYAN|nr:CAP domain-containing protein [Roseofilum reptotaenium]MDB9519293.1 CAP domain-containing protein [Roseofilum reptotaenium CS-1145]OJJ27211.1 hypothetical protein BI308_01605 [Roseofilum reptotaenium AO1-A]